MYCPRCGAGDQVSNAYCKRCGQWLSEINRAVTAFGGDTPQQNIFTGLFMSALSTVAALISAVALYATYLGSGDAKWSVYLAAAFCLCIAGWQASSFAVTLKLRQRMKRGRNSYLPHTETQKVLPASQPTTLISAATVTENTTELLEPRRSKADPVSR